MNLKELCSKIYRLLGACGHALQHCFSRASRGLQQTLQCNRTIPVEHIEHLEQASALNGAIQSTDGANSEVYTVTVTAGTADPNEIKLFKDSQAPREEEETELARLSRAAKLADRYKQFIGAGIVIPGQIVEPVILGHIAEPKVKPLSTQSCEVPPSKTIIQMVQSDEGIFFEGSTINDEAIRRQHQTNVREHQKALEKFRQEKEREAKNLEESCPKIETCALDMFRDRNKPIDFATKSCIRDTELATKIHRKSKRSLSFSMGKKTNNPKRHST